MYGGVLLVEAGGLYGLHGHLRGREAGLGSQGPGLEEPGAGDTLLESCGGLPGMLGTY